MIAFGRQWAVERRLLSENTERDQWEISPPGKERFDGVREKFRNGKYNVRRCYLWSSKFKKWICPDYEPSEQDSKRPAEMLEEYV